MSATKVLNASFFRRPAKIVAEELLGKFLVSKNKAEMITEVEVYDGPNDKASHACHGRTKRTEPMFNQGSIFYIYLCYGFHQMLNIVTGGKDYPAAILIRATDQTNGPGRLTKKFGITKKFNGLPATKKTGLWLEDRGVTIPKSKIKRAPRTGVNYAGPIWSRKNYKFFVKTS